MFWRFAMCRRPSPLIPIICALFLLGAQQAAYAHWISHVGSAENAQTFPDRGNGRDTGDALSHACKTCAAFATLAVAAPAHRAPIAELPAAVTSIPDISPADLPARPASPYTARAPPVVI